MTLSVQYDFQVLGSLFKYRQLDKRTLSIIADRQLYFASAAEFNDPFDCDLHSVTSGSDEQLRAMFEECLKQRKAVEARELSYSLRYRDDRADPDRRANLNLLNLKEAGLFYPAALINSDHTGYKPLFALIDLAANQIATKVPQRHDVWRQALANFYFRLLELAKTEFGICCLSPDPSNILYVVSLRKRTHRDSSRIRRLYPNISKEAGHILP